MKLTSLTTLLFALLLSACSGGGPNPPGGGDDKGTVTLPPPNPLDVGITLDEARAVSQKLPLTGGSMSVTAEDGAIYTLTIPDNALLSETEITMTPLLNIEGSPVTGGKLLGVELKPHGLRLYDFATLTIAPPADSGAKAVGFASEEGGKDFHLYPLSLEPGLSMKLMHFSEHGVFTYCETCPILITDDNPTNSIPIEFVPIDWESQLAQMMEELIRNEREAHLRGEEGDPEFSQKLTEILNAFYIEIIQPMLGRITTDCDFAKANVSKALSWNRQVALLGLDAAFDAETASVTEAMVTGMDNCWQEATQPCVDPNDESFSEVIRTARINQLLGGDPNKYNPNDPELRCDDEACAWVEDVQGWTGSASFAWTVSAEDAENGSATVDRAWDITTTIVGSANQRDNVGYWSGGTGSPGSFTGSASVNDTRAHPMRSGTYSTTGSGTPKRALIILTIYKNECLYDLSAHIEQDVVNRRGETTFEGTLRVGDIEIYGMPISGSTLSGAMSLEYKVDSDPNTSRFSFGWDPEASAVQAIRGDMGQADVTWSFTAVE